MSERDDEPRDKNMLDSIADASWDMFVMPGEAANSRYDRPLGPLDAEPPSTDEDSRENPTFQWGGDKEQNAALRLPSGVKAAERLSVPVERPRGRSLGLGVDEVEGRDIAGDVELLSRNWTRLWAVSVVIALAIVAADGLELFQS